MEHKGFSGTIFFLFFSFLKTFLLLIDTILGKKKKELLKAKRAKKKNSLKGSDEEVAEVSKVDFHVILLCSGS